MNSREGFIIQDITPNDFLDCYEIERKSFPIFEMFQKT